MKRWGKFAWEAGSFACLLVMCGRLLVAPQSMTRFDAVFICFLLIPVLLEWLIDVMDALIVATGGTPTPRSTRRRRVPR